MKKAQDIKEYVKKYGITGEAHELPLGQARPDHVNMDWPLSERRDYKVTIKRKGTKNKMVFYYSKRRDSQWLDGYSLAEEMMDHLAMEEDCEVGKGFERYMSNVGRNESTNFSEMYLYWASSFNVHQQLRKFFDMKKAPIQELQDLDRL